MNTTKIIGISIAVLIALIAVIIAVFYTPTQQSVEKYIPYAVNVSETPQTTTTIYNYYVDGKISEPFDYRNCKLVELNSGEGYVLVCNK